MNNNISNINKHRINFQIKGVSEVRLIDENGQMAGVLDVFEARRRAKEAGLDLVEMNRNSNPPVCKIMDYGKFKFENAKAAKEAKKNQQIVSVKEVTLRPATDLHDIQIKAKYIKDWFESGDKVRIVIRMKGRERVHPQQGMDVLNSLLTEVGPHKVEIQPRTEGKIIVAQIAPA